jgi:hypothetical protein
MRDVRSARETVGFVHDSVTSKQFPVLLLCHSGRSTVQARQGALIVWNAIFGHPVQNRIRPSLQHAAPR